MIKDYFINKIEKALLEAVKENKLGAMNEYEIGTLKVEKPKNSDFGDYAVNVSSLARFAKIAPPQIANTIVEFIEKDDNNIKTGIIDLMIEYNDHIDILDYKLKNINDSDYNKQLLGYKNYIEKLTNKKTNIYLYSLFDSKYREVSSD